jgi:hypothetical protein
VVRLDWELIDVPLDQSLAFDQDLELEPELGLGPGLEPGHDNPLLPLFAYHRTR